jgi:hypothetical protein
VHGGGFEDALEGVGGLLGVEQACGCFFHGAGDVAHDGGVAGFAGRNLLLPCRHVNVEEFGSFTVAVVGEEGCHLGVRGGFCRLQDVG